MKVAQYYKFLDLKDGQIVSRHGSQTWTIGRKYSVKGRINQCSNGFHASVDPLDALRYVGGDVLAVVEGWGNSDDGEDKVCCRHMRIVSAYRWSHRDSAELAVYAAELVLHVYEGAHLGTAPREAIEAAKAYLAAPSAKTASAAYDAAAAAHAASYAAAASAAAAPPTTARAAAASAAAATYTASRAASAAAYATNADAAYAAAYAADAAIVASDLGDVRMLVNEWITNRISQLVPIQ